MARAYHGPRLMTLDMFKSALANAGPVAQVSFAGFAEPFLNRLAAEMVAHAGQVRPSVVIFTTAVGMSLEQVRRLAAVKRLEWITLHLPDAEGCMKFVPTPEYVEVVRALLASGIEIRPMAMGTLHADMVPILAGYKMGGLESMQSRAGHVAMPKQSLVGVRRDRFVQISKAGPLRCHAAPELDHPVLLPDGSLVLCCQSWALEHVLGNLEKQTWDEIYTGDEFLKLRAAMHDGACLCRKCDYAVSA